MVRPSLDGDDFGGAVCFAVEGGPPECSSSEPEPLGRLRIRTEVEGRLARVDDHGFELERGAQRVRVRYLLPRPIDLSSLVGAHVRLTVHLVLDPNRAPTVDACIRTLDGRLVLWARDGALPSDRPGRPQVRVTHSDATGRRLALGLPRGLVSLRAGQRSDVAADDGTVSVFAIRVADDDAAFVLAAS